MSAVYDLDMAYHRRNLRLHGPASDTFFDPQIVTFVVKGRCSKPRLCPRKSYCPVKSWSGPQLARVSLAASTTCIPLRALMPTMIPPSTLTTWQMDWEVLPMAVTS